MDYEKEYKSALERCRWQLENKKISKECATDLFRELEENEDERIRKMLIEQMERWHECALENNVVQDIKDSANAITWLEKQKEQKSIEFPTVHGISEKELQSDFAEALSKTIRHYLDGATEFTDLNIGADAEILFFHLRERLSKALDERFNDGFLEGVSSVKPAEWSEEDEKMLRLCENRIMGTGTFVPTRTGLYDMVSWLKSLRPHWKPSEEQMGWLESAVRLSTDKPHIHGIIISLYEQLKRL